jgi:hypothetical protein
VSNRWLTREERAAMADQIVARLQHTSLTLDEELWLREVLDELRIAPARAIVNQGPVTVMRATRNLPATAIPVHVPPAPCTLGGVL